MKKRWKIFWRSTSELKCVNTTFRLYIQLQMISRKFELPTYTGPPDTTRGSNEQPWKRSAPLKDQPCIAQSIAVHSRSNHKNAYIMRVCVRIHLLVCIYYSHILTKWELWLSLWSTVRTRKNIKKKYKTRLRALHRNASSTPSRTQIIHCPDYAISAEHVPSSDWIYTTIDIFSRREQKTATREESMHVVIILEYRRYPPNLVYLWRTQDETINLKNEWHPFWTELPGVAPCKIGNFWTETSLSCTLRGTLNVASRSR